MPDELIVVPVDSNRYIVDLAESAVYSSYNNIYIIAL